MLTFSRALDVDLSGYDRLVVRMACPPHAIRQVAESDAVAAVKQLGPMDYFGLGIAILTLARQFGGMLKKA